MGKLTACKIIFLFVLSFIFVVNGRAACNDKTTNSQNRLLMFQGFVLSAYYDGQYIEVKRLKPGKAIFYGYGWLDDHRIFIAYQRQDDAEAIADIEVVDMLTGRTTNLKGLAAAGDSNFDVSPDTGKIIFSTGENIRLMTVGERGDSYQLLDILKDTSCWGVFWINSSTIGCKLFEKGKQKLLKLDIKQ